MAIALVCEAKMGLSACQMQRRLGLGSYRTAWHLCHRIRAAMAEKTILTGEAVKADTTKNLLRGNALQYKTLTVSQVSDA